MFHAFWLESNSLKHKPKKEPSSPMFQQSSPCQTQSCSRYIRVISPDFPLWCIASLDRVASKSSAPLLFQNYSCKLFQKSQMFKVSISPAYDPNSKDTSNSHSFCFGTHWKSSISSIFITETSQYHHENITAASPPITETPKHHRHRAETSPTYHQDITTQSLHITETRPRHHRHIT